jgi:hypothetical protein
MKIKTFLLAALTACSLSASAQTDNADLLAVQETLRGYMDGSTYGDTAIFSKAFLHEGQMIFIDNRKTTIVPLKDFVARIKPGIANERQSRIVSLEIEGTAAAARLEIITPKYIFHDYMNLLKTSDGWKIVNKIFHREERKQ